mmetsp:Transcript_55457/g.102591  ORF Transcript_55457/g.102591 Transcript_55457/m.102591 type:complete len:290 (-) Transcript_55457:263-1132(-)
MQTHAASAQAFQGYPSIATAPLVPGPVAAESVPLTEEGYQLVASMRNTAQMAVFIRRVVHSMGGRITREGDLSGFAPYYSGEHSTQSYARLLEELSQKSREFDPWLVLGYAPVAAGVVPAVAVVMAQPVCASGATASLDETGYQAVAVKGCTHEMKVFIRRVVDTLGMRIVNEGGLSGFAPYYSGEKAVQSYQRLVHELLEKAVERGFFKKPFVRLCGEPRRESWCSRPRRPMRAQPWDWWLVLPQQRDPSSLHHRHRHHHGQHHHNHHNHHHHSHHHHDFGGHHHSCF